MKKGTAKRVLALLICVLMAVSMLPTVAMAEEVMDDTIDGSTETYTTYENEDDSNVAALDDEDDSDSSSGIPIEDEKPNTDIKIIPSDANALVLMDVGAQFPKGVPGQVVKIVLPLAVNKEYLPSEKYMLRNINIYPDVPTDTSVSNWPFELIFASDLQRLKDMSYNSTAEVWFEFKISEFASQGRYAVPFKVNATVWREDAVNGTSITEDVTFKITAYVTVTDNGDMSGVTTSFGSLQVAGTNVGGSYTVPTGTPNQTISMRIPVINVGGTLTGVTVTPVVSTSLDEFPFVVSSTNYSQYFSYWASGEIKYLDYTFTVSPFAVSHDVPCVGYTLSAAGKSLSAVTDIGKVTPKVLRAITGSDLVVLESNHDVEMLRRNAKYSAFLKKRILSSHGHLSNDECATAVCLLVASGTKQVILAHLSQENNCPELAFETTKKQLELRGYTEGKDIKVEVAEQNSLSAMYEIV